ncbi:glutaredoxin 3 [Neisseria leonii]|uniref:Glutaredoxin n=1 Tax=Neisseria leonii TaxID=2995413 RepID=A0A9X4IEB5_9NEIS|nr:glutaredoxin 3 [Neisseria sp. 51.81]MDD9328586.1 glutaredoxin 3 [Neisseria sp. 51.81]
MQKVTVYSGLHCPYCVMAKQLLAQVGVTQIEEITQQSDPGAFRKMVEETATRTVPQIFIGDTHVGGFTDLRALHQAGGLLPLLHGQG